MRISDNIHLTYCLNVHPGQTWAENFTAIREFAIPVRNRVCPGKAFGLGLRLAAQAAEELLAPGKLEAFRQFLSEHGLYAFTINGFPYGHFHHTAVKQDVYAPDWADPRRVQYTLQLAEILCRLLPAGVPGSISTVPLSYKAWVKLDEQIRPMVENLAVVAAFLHKREDGRNVAIALEPEPDCLIETTAEAIAFFEKWTPEAIACLQRKHGLSADDAADAWRRHIGVCFDTAHAAVEFEDLLASIRQLRQAGVTLAKVQLSSALSVKPTPATLARLGQFVDKVYLHQVKARRSDGSIASFADLPEALASFRAASVSERTNQPSPGRVAGPLPDGLPDVASAKSGRGSDMPAIEELRIHYHVPLFYDAHEGLESTNRLLRGHFAAALRAGACGNLEIETYTFTVLPEFLRPADLRDAIAKEFEWVHKQLLVTG